LHEEDVAMMNKTLNRLQRHIWYISVFFCGDEDTVYLYAMYMGLFAYQRWVLITAHISVRK